MQTLIVIIILTIAVAYASWRTYTAFTCKKNTCEECKGCIIGEILKNKKKTA